MNSQPLMTVRILAAPRQKIGAIPHGMRSIVPVIGGGGNCDAQNPTAITDFAKIYPKSIDKTGNPKYIVADIVCNQTLTSLENSLCFNHRLVREKVKNM